MRKVKLDKVLEQGRGLFLSYSWGLEQGPLDFNIHNMDPEHVIDIAVNGPFNGLILHKGIAEVYQENFSKKVPLIMKLNGKTNLSKGTYYAPQICSVEKAAKLGADAVGYNLFVGSSSEHLMFKEFSKIRDAALDFSLPTIAWIKPVGKYVNDPMKTSMLAYCSRVGLEIGADMACIAYNGVESEFKWVVKCAGDIKVIMDENKLRDDREILKRVKEAVGAGVSGVVLGKEVWQHKSPLKISESVREIVFEEKEIDDVLKEIMDK